MKSQFKEVVSTYVDENGSIAIDCYTAENLKNDTEGLNVAKITLDGEVEWRLDILNPLTSNPIFDDNKIKRQIKLAKERQEIEKQKLVDMSIEKIKEDILDGDLTVIEELLQLHKAEYLRGFLCIPE
jgi:hypothetical protein